MDPISLLLPILMNKYVLGGIAIVGAITGIYLRGRSSGVNSVKADEQDAMDALNKAVSKTESKNQSIQQQGSDKAQEVINADDNTLADLLNDLTKEEPK